MPLSFFTKRKPASFVLSPGHSADREAYVAGGTYSFIPRLFPFLAFACDKPELAEWNDSWRDGSDGVDQRSGDSGGIDVTDDGAGRTGRSAVL